MLNIKDSSNILVVVAHPDDEAWGLLGTLLRLKDEFEANISIVMVSDGDRGDGTGEERLKGSRDLCEEMDFDFKCFDVPANTLRDFMPNITLRLDHKIAGFEPTAIFSHFGGDTHIDHKAVNECVLASLRGWPSTSYLQIETPFKKRFLPNFYVNITKYFDEKKKFYVDYFSSEIKLRPEYDLDGVEIVNRYRGLQFGTEYAEAFILNHGGIM